jgi:hypothetical protein
MIRPALLIQPRACGMKRVGRRRGRYRWRRRRLIGRRLRGLGECGPLQNSWMMIILNTSGDVNSITEDITLVGNNVADIDMRGNRRISNLSVRCAFTLSTGQLVGAPMRKAKTCDIRCQPRIHAL